jgi:hypothetical protein
MSKQTSKHESVSLKQNKQKGIRGYKVVWEGKDLDVLNEPLLIFGTTDEAKKYIVGRQAIVFDISSLYDVFKAPYEIIPVLITPLPTITKKRK